MTLWKSLKRTCGVADHSCVPRNTILRLELAIVMKVRVTLMSLLLTPFFLLHAQDIPPANVIKGLGSEDFASRENAQAELLKWAQGHPLAATPEILSLFEGHNDPEVRKRALEILQTLADADYLSDGQGYLGILMQEEPLEVAQDRKARFGIRILDVMKGSPAEQAELKMGDLIVSLDGKEWEAVGAVTAFSETIAAKKPLIEVKLKVKRDRAEPIGFTVKLGKRPIPDLRLGGDLGLLEQQAKERHFKQWLRKQQDK